MAHGRLRCLGSAQHLKAKFGRGYQVELKAYIPQHGDEDITNTILFMGRRRQGYTDEQIETRADQILFSYNDAIATLQALSGDKFLSDQVTADSPTGYIIYKEANSENGVSLAHLAHFATALLRMRSIDAFIRSTYPMAILREGQDLKARYEINADGLSIAHVFDAIECNRRKLMIEDYGVSQTSLEQVFNRHAAEAAEALQNS